MKMKPYTNIDEYITNFPEETQQILQKIRKMANDIIPNAEETISYGIPTLKLNGKYVVYFAGYEHHVSLHPVPPGSEEFVKKIEPYVAGKGTMKFMLNKPIPYDIIEEIIKTNLQRYNDQTKNS
jgi:uncharacterized protein YdhG (YjbR/CyaY superfamily)